MLHGFYTHVKDPNYREEENVLPSGDNEENLKKPSRKGFNIYISCGLLKRKRKSV